MNKRDYQFLTLISPDNFILYIFNILGNTFKHDKHCVVFILHHEKYYKKERK